MKPFEMHPKMLTMGGAFYPTGYAFIMFPQAEDVEQVAQKLEASGIQGDHIMHLTPEAVIRHIGGADGESQVRLPSIGTEGHTVHRYLALAREGHHALMVRAPSDKETEALMNVVHGVPFSFGQKYHMLAIEDLE